MSSNKDLILGEVIVGVPQKLDYTNIWDTTLLFESINQQIKDMDYSSLQSSKSSSSYETSSVKSSYSAISSSIPSSERIYVRSSEYS